MTPDEIARWRRVEQVLDHLLEAEAEDRAALLQRLCDGDEKLRQEVAELLEADQRASGFLEHPAFAMLGIAGGTALTLPPLEAGRMIGPYRLLRQLGLGGMGTVYLAERADGQFNQQVALKLIRQDAGSPELVQRFLSERQILARLNHAHIARLLDGGTTAEGQPWFALEYVEGESITAYADDRSLALAQRFDLFAQVADAVRHAHTQGVIHRDLKPSNILVTADGDVKLLDFGIAKDTSVSGGDAPTGSSGAVLTPEYCAPEQVMGQPATVATDVYALGAVLYELLTGRRAHRVDQHAPGAVYRAVCEAELVPPSVVVLENGGTARHGQLEVVSLGHALRGDLDAILSRALEKVPAQRYRTVDDLMDDLNRHRSGHPIRARKATTGYRFRKFLQRNRRSLVAASVVVVTGVGFLIVSSVGRQSSPATERTAVAHRLFEEGRAAFRRVDLIGAQRLYQAALAEDSTLSIVAYYAGQLAFTMGNPSEGYRLTALARQGLAKLPRFERLRLQHAWAALGNTPARFLAAESLLAAFPDEPIAVLTHGNEMWWAGRIDSAIRCFRRAIELASRRPDTMVQECILCDGHERLANAYMDTDSMVAAERVVEQWLRTGKDSTTALANLAMVLSRQDRHQEALEVYRQLVQRTPHQSQLYFVHSAVMIRAGRINELIRFLDEQDRVQGISDALWFKTIALRNAGRLDEALVTTRRNRTGAEIDSVNSAWIPRAMIQAQVLREKGEFAASAALFDSLARAAVPWTRVGPGIEGRHRTWCLTHEATSLALLGDTTGLIRVMKEVERYASQSAWIREEKLEHYVRGLLHRARRHPDSALAEFRAAAFPGFGPADLAAAELLIGSERATEAVALLQRTLRVSEIQSTSTYHTITGLHLALARALDAAAVRDSARFHYLWVARAWSEGDPPFRTEARKAALRASLLFSRESALPGR